MTGSIGNKLIAAINSREKIRLKFNLPEDLPFSEYADNINISVTPGDGVDTTTTNPPQAYEIVSGKEVWANGVKIIGTANVVTPSFDSSTGKFTVSEGFVNTAYSKSLGTITSSNTTVSDDTITIPVGYNKTKFTKKVAPATITEKNNTLTITKGWLSEQITRELGINTNTDNPALPELVYDGFEFFANGEKYIGTALSSDIIIDPIDGGGHNITVTPGFVSERFEQSVDANINLGFITAEAGDIRLGKVGADSSGNMIEGTLVVSEPSTDIDVEYGYVDANGKFQALDLSGDSPVTVGNPTDFSAIMYKTEVDEPSYDQGSTDSVDNKFNVVKVIDVIDNSVKSSPMMFSMRSSTNTIPSRIIVGGLQDGHSANGVYEINGDIVEGKALTDYSYSHVESGSRYQIYYSTGMGMDDWSDKRWAIFDVEEQCPVVYKTDNPTSLLEACSWYTWSDDSLRHVSVWEENTKLFDNIIVSGFSDDTQGNGEYEWREDTTGYTYPFGGFYVNKAGNGRYIAFYDMEGDGGTWWLLTDVSFNDEPLAWLASSPSIAPLTEPDGEQSWTNTNDDSITVTFTVQRDTSSEDTVDPLSIPLTFTAEEAGSTIRIVGYSMALVDTLQYRLGLDGDWIDYNIDILITLDNVGDVVQFQNTTESFSSSWSHYNYFVMTGKIAASGNIQSLLNWSDSCKEGCYSNLFYFCTSLTKAPELPATKLAGYCYYKMFSACKNLTEAPVLPATILARNCYEGMFESCTNLTTAPELPATNLTVNCYIRMFRKCNSLINAPVLPATTLDTGCYYSMFDSCTSLINAPDLPATTLVNSCYHNMFDGCKSLSNIKVSFLDWSSTSCTDWMNEVSSTGTFYKPSSLPEIRGTDNIPEGWTIVNESDPIIPDDPEELPSLSAVVVKATEYSGDNYVFSNDEITIDNCPSNVGIGDMYIMSDLSLIQKLN